MILGATGVCFLDTAGHLHILIETDAQDQDKLKPDKISASRGKVGTNPHPGQGTIGN